ncbi:MAG: hypothetical protein RL215_2582, partial [Planctomycetota bacterium]
MEFCEDGGLADAAFGGEAQG